MWGVSCILQEGIRKKKPKTGIKTKKDDRKPKIKTNTPVRESDAD
jgi:hypothetical protein